jgi:Ser/Thr protein kinase RdoA (MazF antagonist)
MVAACQGLLGAPVTAISDLSWPQSSNQVLELTTADGRRWIAKVAGGREHYRREKHALQCWAPALGRDAPELVAAEDELLLLVMTRLPGRRAEETAGNTGAAVHEQAGRLTRLLHDAEPPTTDDGIAAATVQRLEDWIERGRELLNGDEIAFARNCVRPIAGLGPLPTVPCHMDNQPRNWVVDDAGHVGMIDFGGARRDVWIRDLQRMYFQQWEHRPDLRDAFYAGYGRTPDDADLLLLRCYLAHGGLSTVVWAHEFGDPPFEAHGHRILAELMAGADPTR